MQKVVVRRRGTFKEIPTKLIRESESPSREVYEDLNGLSKSIRELGVIEPLVVKKLKDGYGFEVVCGSRRLKASQKAGVQSVPCIILDGELSDDQILEMQLTENIQRLGLKAFETIRIMRILKDKFQLTNQEIGSKIGLSDSSVGDYLLIGEKLPWEYVKQISHGSHTPKDLTISKAAMLARANLPIDELKDLLRLLKRVGYTRGALARKLARIQHKSKIKRVHQGRVYWNELTRSLKEFARYWANYAVLKEWEDVSSFHLELKVTLPKDLTESKA